MKTWMILLSAATAFLATQVVAAGNPEAGKEKNAICVACHMADGNSMNPEWPKLAGQHEKYLAKQLREFKSGDRQNAIMLGMVAALSEEDMDDLAAFYATQTIQGGTADPEMVELGRSIYVSGNPTSGVAACAACHGPTGTGNPAANFPSLQGQHALYTENQLKAFRSGERANDAGMMMRNIAGVMTDAEMAAVAQYIQGLR